MTISERIRTHVEHIIAWVRITPSRTDTARHFMTYRSTDLAKEGRRNQVANQEPVIQTTEFSGDFAWFFSFVRSYSSPYHSIQGLFIRTKRVNRNVIKIIQKS
jgi:hypothetical protein